MKARSKFKNGENRYEVYFAYEDYYGGTKFRSYDEMQEKGDFTRHIDVPYDCYPTTEELLS